jgi:hypothetical protein
VTCVPAKMENNAKELIYTLILPQIDISPDFP